MTSVKERLGLIQGVLMMVEQYGAAMLTEEMLSLADFIIEHKKERNDQTIEILLRAVLQLPDYLEHIQSGNRDIPIAILPMLNDIRAVKNQDLFSEKLLFLPDLSMHSQGAEAESIEEPDNQASKLLAKKLRPIYQFSLLKIIKEEAVDENLKRLEKVCETLEERAFSEQVARIWWIIGALIESASRHQLELGVSIKSLLGKVDALFRVILIIGERGLLKRQPIDLIKNFLYYIAQPECDGPKTQAIKTAYRLEQFLPSEASRSKLLDNIAGPNQALLKTVAEAMKTDIEAVKSTLEVYVNSDPANIELLKDIPQDLHVISDTLAMIGLGQQRQLIEAQISLVKSIVEGEQQGSDEQLLSMASELIQVEHALDLMQKRQPVEDEQSGSETDVSRDYELAGTLTAVVTAALDDIQKTKGAILDFIKDPTRKENIDLCVALMEESRGALALLNKDRAVAVVDGLIQYLDSHDIVEFMDTVRLDALSQVVVSLEYYLEAIGERQGDAESILDFADAQLQDLLSNTATANKLDDGDELVILDEESTTENESPVSSELVQNSEIDEDIELGDGAPAVESMELEDSTAYSGEDDSPVIAAQISIDSDVDSSVDLGDISTDISELPGIEDDSLAVNDFSEELGSIPDESNEFEAEAPEFDEAGISLDEAIPGGQALNVVPVTDESETLIPGSDPEILEIYLEEAEEEALNVARLQQDWLLHSGDENAIKNIRRAFHTIKGSGRLVGALRIAEFAWDYEHLLNLVIDKTIQPSDEIINAVGQAAVALSELVAELNSGQQPTADIPYLRGLARALAEFNAEQVMIERTGILQAVTESPYDQITDDSVDPGSVELGASEFEDIEIEEPIAEAPSEAAEVATDTGEKQSEEGPPDPLALATKDLMPGKEVGEGVPNSQEEDELTGLSFDPELLTIYQQEVEQHLSTINSALDYSEQINELIPSEDFYRALRTIHGASRTADISSIGEWQV